MGSGKKRIKKINQGSDQFFFFYRKGSKTVGYENSTRLTFGMKRHRNSTGFCETAEDELYSPNKKSAEALDGSQFGGPGIGASRSSPQLPLTRPDGAFSPRTLHHHATAPLPIRAVLQEDTENHAALMSFSPHALKIPICSTPEELKSPHLHTPPPRPNKSSPPGSAAAKATHPQTEVTHVPLQELVTRIKLRPCTLPKCRPRCA